MKPGGSDTRESGTASPVGRRVWGTRFFPTAGRDTAILLTPAFHAWDGRDVLTLRYTALYQQKEYAATFTVTK